MCRRTTATLTVEVELTLTGTFQPGYAATGPSYASGGEPGEPPGFEDVEIADVGVLVRVPGFYELDEFTQSKRWVASRYEPQTLLNGVDKASPAYRQIVANLLKAVDEQDAHAALMEAVADDDARAADYRAEMAEEDRRTA